jgi:predicted nucleotidyltransferase
MVTYYSITEVKVAFVPRSSPRLDCLPADNGVEWQTTMDAARELDKLVERIVDAVHPLKIILFGSAARGEMGPDSDVDVLVVMPDGTHRRHTAQHLYRTIRGIKLPYDIMVATPSDLEEQKDNIGLIYYTILEEGRELYAA